MAHLKTVQKKKRVKNKINGCKNYGRQRAQTQEVQGTCLMCTPASTTRVETGSTKTRKIDLWWAATNKWPYGKHWMHTDSIYIFLHSSNNESNINRDHMRVIINKTKEFVVPKCPRITQWFFTEGDLLNTKHLCHINLHNSVASNPVTVQT